MELTVISLVVGLLLVVVLGMQIQLSALSRKIDEKEDRISKKMDQLLKEKEKEKEKNKNNLKLSNTQF